MAKKHKTIIDAINDRSEPTLVESPFIKEQLNKSADMLKSTKPLSKEKSKEAFDNFCKFNPHIIKRMNEAGVYPTKIEDLKNINY